MDVIEKDFNVEDYRKQHECSAEWKLRRAFILSNKDQLGKDELVTLASCYVNVHYYGCKYPEELMQRLSHYEDNVEKSLLTVNPPIERTKLVAKRVLVQETWKPPPARNDKVIMNDTNQLPSLPSELVHIERKFAYLSTTISGLMRNEQADNAVSLLQMAIDKNQMTSTAKFKDLPNGKFCCVLQVNCINLSEGEANNKKQAKSEAYQNAISILQMPCLKINKSKVNPSEYVLIGTRNIEHHAKPICKKPEKRANLDINFVLLSQQDIQHSATSILRRSAEFNKSQLDFDVEYLMKDNTYECKLTVEGKVLSSDKKGTREEAMAAAAEKALEVLKKTCYTILSKNSGDVDISDAIQREQVLCSETSSLTSSMEEAIPDSNIGNKLLRMMGWSEGGVGKEGNHGITSPVKLSTVSNREGLGLQTENGIAPEFQPSVSRIVEDFVKSDKQDDLIFAPTFTVKERSIIHNVAQKLHLKTKSHNKGEERYLVLSRKRSPRELLDHLLANNNETRCYKLVPPTG